MLDRVQSHSILKISFFSEVVHLSFSLVGTV